SKEKDNKMSVSIEEKGDKYIVVYYGNGGKEINSTYPIAKSQALFLAFRKGFLLHLYETRVKDLLRKNGLKDEITDKDINIFITRILSKVPVILRWHYLFLPLRLYFKKLGLIGLPLRCYHTLSEVLIWN